MRRILEAAAVGLTVAAFLGLLALTLAAYLSQPTIPAP